MAYIKENPTGIFASKDFEICEIVWCHAGQEFVTGTMVKYSPSLLSIEVASRLEAEVRNW